MRKNTKRTLSALTILLIFLSGCIPAPVGTPQPTISPRKVEQANRSLVTPQQIPTETYLPAATKSPSPVPGTKLPPVEQTIPTIPISTLTQIGPFSPSEVISPENISRLTPFRKISGPFLPAVAWIEGGKELAFAGENEVLIFDAKTRKKLGTFEYEPNGDRPAFSPDGSLLAAGGMIWKVPSGDKLPFTYKGYHPVFSPSGKSFAALQASDPWSNMSPSDLYIYDLEIGKVLYTYHGVEDVVYIPGLDWEVKRLALSRSFPYLMNLETGQQVVRLPTVIGSYVFSPDGKYLAGTDSEAWIWNADTGKTYRLIDLNNPGWNGLSAFSPDETLLAVGSLMGEISLCDVARGKKLYTTPRNGRYLTSIDFSPDGKYLAIADKEMTMDVLSVASGQELYKINAIQPVDWEGNAFSLSPDRTLTASVVTDKARIEDATTHTLLGEVQHPGIHRTSFSPDGQFLVTLAWPKGLKVWRIGGGLSFKLVVDNGAIIDAKFLNGGKHLAVASSYGIQILDTHTWKPIKSLGYPPRHEAGFKHLATSPQGNYVAAMGFSWIRVWNTDTWEIVQYLDFVQGTSEGAGSISPDGKYLVAEAGNWFPEEFYLYVFDLATGYPIRMIPSAGVSYLAFSPDGKLLVADEGNDFAYKDHFLTVYDSTWNKIGEIRNASGPFSFSQDGKVLVTAGEVFETMMWGIP